VSSLTGGATIPRRLFTGYRILALVVGVLLVVGSLASLAKYLLTEGTALQTLGADLTFVWLVHGWIYMVYVVVAFLLTRKAGWSVPQLLIMLLAGLIPVTIFFVEHQTTRRLRREHPELATA
jgi:integral membrane protein